MSDPATRTTITTARGDRIGFDRHGDGGAATSVIFVAGAGPFRAIDPVTTATAELMPTVSSIVYDRLGRGDSAAVGGDIGLDRELEALSALIELVGGRAVLCGHSSGCTIALAAAARGLGVAGLVLFEAPLGQAPEATREWIGEFERRLDAGAYRDAMDQYMKDMPQQWRAALLDDPVWVGQAPSLRADGESLVWAESGNYAATFAAVRVPVLTVVGRETFPSMPEAAHVIAAAIPGGTSTVVAGADHSWDPGAMAALLTDFVRSVDERSPGAAPPPGANRRGP